MKFQDFFVPRWQHSNPDVRHKALLRVKDQKLLRQIMDDDEDEMVRQAAKQRLTELGSDKVTVDI